MKIIDGYNLVGAGGRLGLRLDQEDKEERLLRLLASYRRRAGVGERFVVVFDADHGRLVRGPLTETRGGITVEWAVGESADAAIVRRVRKARNPRGLEVVTADGEIVRRVRQARGRTTHSADFARTMAASLEGGENLEKPGDPSPEQVDRWLEIFADGDGSEESGSR